MLEDLDISALYTQTLYFEDASPDYILKTLISQLGYDLVLEGVERAKCEVDEYNALLNDYPIGEVD